MSSARSTSAFAVCAAAFALASAAGCRASASDELSPAVADLTIAQLPIRLTVPIAGTFAQAIDHPRTPSTKDAPVETFKQRYWYTTEFASGPDSPVLFHFCGESACSASFLSSLGDAAKSLHASIVALEHRYYGQSLPFADPTLDDMKYLSIHNALEDVVAFETFAKAELPLAGKWIAVGGSYAGMLATFYRQKHPDLVVGAWASSAPIDIQRSFFGYDAIASRALGPVCLTLFQQVLGRLERAYDDPAQLGPLSTALLGFEWKATMGRQNFFRRLTNNALGEVQYGRAGRLCQALEQHSDNPVDGLIAFRNPPLIADPSDVVTADAGSPVPGTQQMPEEILAIGPGDFTPAPGPDESPRFRGRQWYYQVCTEVGFFQVANPDRSQSIIAPSETESRLDDECQRIVHSRPDIAKTRAEYYDPIMAGQISNVFFVNGSLDPWSALSPTSPAAAPPNTTVFVVKLGSHCTDLSNLRPDSPIPVFEAHVKFNELARRWLAE